MHHQKINKTNLLGRNVLAGVSKCLKFFEKDPTGIVLVSSLVLSSVGASFKTLIDINTRSPLCVRDIVTAIKNLEIMSHEELFVLTGKVINYKASSNSSKELIKSLIKLNFARDAETSEQQRKLYINYLKDEFNAGKKLQALIVEHALIDKSLEMTRPSIRNI